MTACRCGRYRLDGIDVNIEWRPNNFAQHLCKTFKLLHERLGPDLIVTVTPCELHVLFSMIPHVACSWEQERVCSFVADLLIIQFPLRNVYRHADCKRVQAACAHLP